MTRYAWVTTARVTGHGLHELAERNLGKCSRDASLPQIGTPNGDLRQAAEPAAVWGFWGRSVEGLLARDTDMASALGSGTRWNGLLVSTCQGDPRDHPALATKPARTL